MSATPKPVVRVTGLATTAVKGLQMLPRSELMLTRAGVRENRRFFVVDERDRMVNGKNLGALSTVRGDYNDADRSLALRFPDGRVVDGMVELGAAMPVSFFSLELRAAPVLGPFSAALSAHVGAPVRVMEAARESGAVDRGAAGPISLISDASLRALAAIAAVEQVDVRRFRMLIEVDGIDAHEEDRWVGQRVQIGEALVAFEGHVGRCLVTSRDPESGEIDLPTLDLLRSYRGSEPSTEPLPFGVYGRVIEPGRVRLGDPAYPVNS